MVCWLSLFCFNIVLDFQSTDNCNLYIILRIISKCVIHLWQILPLKIRKLFTVCFIGHLGIQLLCLGFFLFIHNNASYWRYGMIIGFSIKSTKVKVASLMCVINLTLTSLALLGKPRVQSSLLAVIVGFLKDVCGMTVQTTSTFSYIFKIP